MLFQVTDVEFDFTDDSGEDSLSDDTRQTIYDEVVGNVWEASDEEDLVEEITCAVGWCIKSIDYRHVLV